MPTHIDVFQTPEDLSGIRIDGKIAVVIDVLRASTTITSALAAGASAVIAVETIEQARDYAARHPDALTGGERKGRRIEGFDLGNSPLEYLPRLVAGREIVFSTTNGTRAIAACHSAARLVIGSFVNASSLVDRLVRARQDIVLACAGTDGAPTLEDSMLAGLICESLTSDSNAGHRRLGVAARAAREIWRTAARQQQPGITLFDQLCQSRGGQNLIRIDHAEDIRFAADQDRFDVIGQLDLGQNRIVAERPVQTGAAGDKLA